jgi:hypothetical protein
MNDISLKMAEKSSEKWYSEAASGEREQLSVKSRVERSHEEEAYRALASAPRALG